VITEPTVQAETITIWLAEAESQIKARSDYLTQLDAAIGDGDHGTNMRRGFDAVGKALAGQGSDTPPGRLLIVAGKTLVSTVGGASGPLWGSALRRAGRALGGAETFDGEQLALALDAAIDGVVELGAAVPGDKTMVDALVPAVRALHDGLAADQSLADAVRAGAEAAWAGAESTVPMRARKGRASYLGERSIGHQDPGATSAAIILTALSHAVSAAPAYPS
jgi:dihydroxyacetone kinase-like protein